VRLGKVHQLASCERVVAALVLREGASSNVGALRTWGKQRLAAYKVPVDALELKELPRNAMGKVSKPDLKRIMEARK
jgi:non-ribosomal peptide synthetase component E (peptide arylation enzyme)